MKAVILDMDGVIIDSEDYFEKRMVKFLIEQGVNENFDFSKLAGQSLRDSFETIRGQLNDEIDFEEFLERYEHIPKKIYKEDCELRENIRPILQEIEKRNLMVVLCTSSSRETIETIFKRFSLDKFFDQTFSTENLEAEGKPSSEVYESVSQNIEITPEECLVVEDAENGVRSAKKAGMKVIGLKGTKGQSLDEADWKAENGRNLKEIIERVLQSE